MLPRYSILTSEEVEKIHEASLKVLESAGVFLNHPKAHEVLSALGAKVSDDRTKVFFPRDMVEKVLAQVPREFTCAARDPGFDLKMVQGRRYMRQVGGPISLFDMTANAITPLTLKDNIDSARLIGALPNIHVASAMTPQDINPKTYDIAVVKALLENSRKHFWALTVHSSHLKYELEMAAVVAGGRENLKKRPLISGIFCVIDPLRYPEDEIDRLLIYAQYNTPVRVPITSMSGANAPYTLAGALTQINAEFLSAAVIVQALAPGLGQWYYVLLQTLDMKSAGGVSNGPEMMLLYAAAAQMARHYNIPSTFSTGTVGDTQSHQALLHYATTQTLASLMDITEQGGAGSIQSASFYSHQALVLIDEILSYLNVFSQGINFDDERLAVDDIKAMSAKGDYLSSRLTLKYLRKETRFQPGILDRRTLSEWEAKPDTIIDRAAAKVEKILAGHEIPPLAPEVLKELDDLMEAAEKQFN